jgi:hypothetical protein
MTYRLDELAKLASELGLEWQRLDDNRLDVTVAPGAVLTFCNLVVENDRVVDDNDTLVGFDGTRWHAHGVVPFMTGRSTYTDCDELDILVGLGSGELVVVSQYLRGELNDRWLAHKDEPLDLQYIEAGEELRIHRLHIGGGDATEPGAVIGSAGGEKSP